VIEVYLLGPPRVERNGELVAFDTRKAVALLAVLALTDRPRPRDALVDLLWPGTDPERGRGAFRRTLSTLRSAVGADLVEATRDHVRLVKGPDLLVDVDGFRQARADGDAERAAELFRGDFLEGFAVRDAPEFEDWVRAEGDGLHRELAAALSDLASAHEARGDRPRALQTVRRWLSLDPLHEPAHRELMRLFAATGDRASALTQYRECVRVLSRELGVSPLTETTRLYEAVNQGTYDPGPLDRPTEPPASAPSALPLVGRDEDLRACAAVHAEIDTVGRVVVVEGEAGIGKTRLVGELVAVARRRGARTLAAQAYEDEAGSAYAPVVEALRSRLTEGAAWLSDVGDHALSEAARLLPELADARAFAPAPPLDGPGGRARFLAALWEALVAAVAGDVPGVLFLDDVQWADDATLGLLSYGLRRLEGRPLLLALAWRTPHDHAVRRAATEVARTGGGAVRRLERLGPESVDELVRAGAGEDVDPTVCRQLLATTEGLPLLLVEYLRSAEVSDDDWRLPSAARDLLRSRLDPVSETGRQVMAAAAVIGRSFDVDAVRRVSGRTDDETVAALEELVGRGLVRERRDDYDFAHEQLRVLAYDETSLARRRLLHGRVGDAVGGEPGAVARHLQLAGRDDEAARAYLAAGEQARAVFANVEALAHLRAALALGHPDRTAVQTAIGDLQTRTGDYAGALLSLETAASGCGGEQLAAIEHRLGRLHHRRGEWALAEAHLRAALEASPVEARAVVTADLSLTVHSGPEPDRAWALATEARDLAERADDPGAQCQAYNLLGMLATADGDTEGALESLGRSRRLAEQTGDLDLRVAALNNQALARRARGELDAACELTTAALDLCTAVGDRHRQAALHNNLADLLHASGRPDDAMTHLKTAVAIFAEVGAEEALRPEVWKLVRW